MTGKMVVYCSGPMFSPEEKATMAQIAAILENAGFDTYLPQRDGIEVARVMKLINTPLATLSGPLTQLVRKTVFCLDYYQVLIRCGALVFNMNGRVPDEGAVVETVAAFTAGKPLVIYKDSAIAMLNGQDNPMISGLSYSFKTVKEIERIPDELKKTIEKIQTARPSAYVQNMPPFVEDVTKFGQEIWEYWQSLRNLGSRESHLIEFLGQSAKFGKDAIAFHRTHWR